MGSKTIGGDPMTFFKSVIFFIISFLILGSLNITTVRGEVKASASNHEPIAVELVIDTSGSMKSTDPKLLREKAAETFVSLLNSYDYLGIVTFNNNAVITLPIERLNNSTKENIHNILIPEVSKVSGATDYVLALTAAEKQLDVLQSINIKKVIIFLTDGKPDPGFNEKTTSAYRSKYYDLLWRKVDELATKKYEVHSIGFSKGIDTTVLKTICAMTKGSFNISQGVANLPTSFLQVSKELKLQEPKPVVLATTFEGYVENSNASTISSAYFIIIILLIVLIFMYLFGILLYATVVKANTIVMGKLFYYSSYCNEGERSIDLSLKNSASLNLCTDKSSGLVIASKEDLQNTNQVTFKIKINAKQSKFKFVNGWRWIFNRSQYEMQIVAVPPHYFISDEKAYSNKTITNNISFAINGFNFHYVTLVSNKIEHIEKGKNILEVN